MLDAQRKMHHINPQNVRVRHLNGKKIPSGPGLGFKGNPSRDGSYGLVEYFIPLLNQACTLSAAAPLAFAGTSLI